MDLCKPTVRADPTGAHTDSDAAQRQNNSDRDSHAANGGIAA